MQVGLTFALKPGMLPYICFCFFWVGVSTTAAAPILLELVTEVTYPHPEMLSAGVYLKRLLKLLVYEALSY